MAKGKDTEPDFLSAHLTTPKVTDRILLYTMQELGLDTGEDRIELTADEFQELERRRSKVLGARKTMDEINEEIPGISRKDAVDLLRQAGLTETEISLVAPDDEILRKITSITTNNPNLIDSANNMNLGINTSEE